MKIWLFDAITHFSMCMVFQYALVLKLLWIWSCTVPFSVCVQYSVFFPQKTATLHLNIMIAKIKIKGVRVWRAAWQRCVTFRERAREEGGAGGMDSCSKADCAGCLSYQGSSHASKSQIKHPHLSFQPAALLQVPAPSLPPCVTVPSVDYQLWSKAGALTGSEQNGEVGTWGISCCYHFVSGRCHFHGQIHMRLRYAFLLLFVQECVCVCAHFAGWFVVCCGCVCCAGGKLLESCWELSEA